MNVIGTENERRRFSSEQTPGLELFHASVRTQMFAQPDAFYHNLPEERHCLDMLYSFKFL